MADFATLYLQLKNQQFNSGIDKSSGKLKSFGIGGAKVTAILGIMSTAMIFLGKKAVDAASDANEVSDKFGTVFEGAGDEAERTARRISKSYGIAISTSKELLSSTGDILSGFGFTDKKSLQLSKRVLKLGSDLASFSNIEGGATRAVQALTKALVGETESAKALGVVIRQNSKEFKELVKEGMEMRGETLLQAKAMAALTIAVSQSPKAIGDTARTWGSYANATKRVDERMKGLKESFGRVLLEGLNLGKMADDLSIKLQDLTTSVNDNGNEWAITIKSVAINFKASALQSWNAVSWLFGNITTVFTTAGSNISSFFNWVMQNEVKLLKNSFRVISSFFLDVINAGTNFRVEFIKALISGEDISDAFALAFAGITKNMNKMADDLNLTTLKIDDPEFKGLSELTDGYKKIEKNRAKAQKDLFDNAMKNAQEIGKTTKKSAEDTAKIMGSINGAQRFTEAVFAGTIEAQKRELGQISSNKATENNTKKTADSTKKIAKSSQKLADSFRKPPVFVMA